MDVLNRYRDRHHVSSDDDDDSEDSDKECTVWKRATVKRDFSETLPNNGVTEILPDLPNNEIKDLPLSEQPKPLQKRKINTIWCDVLEDQLISEDLEDCLLKNKPRNYGSRGKESYDYTLRHTDEKRIKYSDSEMSGCSLNEEDNRIDLKSQKKHFPARKQLKKFVKLDPVELDAARKINKVLNEKKYYLIQRIVKYVGIEKAMHLLELTKEIEDNGGMMIKNMSRRRTPGGVYIQKLKEDKEVTKEMRDKIFEGEISSWEQKRYNEQRKKKKKKNLKHCGKGNLKPKKAVESKSEQMESSEIAHMDEDVMSDEKSEISNPNINVNIVPVTETNPLRDVSDLEEGEIED